MLLSGLRSDTLLYAAPVLRESLPPRRSGTWEVASMIQHAFIVSEFTLLGVLFYWDWDSATLRLVALIYVATLAMPFDVVVAARRRAEWMAERKSNRIEVEFNVLKNLEHGSTAAWLAWLEPIGRYPAVLLLTLGILSASLVTFSFTLVLGLIWLAVVAAAISYGLSKCAQRARKGLCPSCSYPWTPEIPRCAECGICVERPQAV
jgi:hypothetical protein